MKVKICGIANRENLLEIIELNPDFMGFIFYPFSPRYMKDKLSPVDLLEIPVSINKTGVFVNMNVIEIVDIVSKYNLDYIQLHGNESIDDCKQLSSSGLNVIKAFRLNKDFNFDILSEYIPYCRCFLFDTYTPEYGGSGKKFNWDIIKKYKSGHPFLLSGGIEPSDAEKILSFSHPSFIGIDLNSRFELSSGIKDVDKLKMLMKSVR
ncbi:MAG: phosphoribosylanthranilate isomerase [Bacteroidales bacterium]|nr:phosphoribosylanthranilate isomerase [Bacteroidales bacterium]